MTQDPKTSNKDKTATDLEIEKQLLPRLKFMGVLLLLFSVCAFCFSLFFSLPSPQKLATAPSNPSEEFAALPNLVEENFLAVENFDLSLVFLSFAIVGGLCLFFAWKKKKHLGA